MLYQAKLPLEFWAKACSTAVYLHNRSPTAALKDETPFQRLFGRRPNISNLRVFGCVSYVHVPDSQRRKLDAKAHRAIFVGYPPGVKGYKLYDLEKKKFIVSRNVQFFEGNFDHSDEKVKSDDAGQADLRFIYPDMRNGGVCWVMRLQRLWVLPRIGPGADVEGACNTVWDDLATVLQAKHPKVVDGVGKLKDYKLTLYVEPQVTPIAQKPRRVPFALREKVSAKEEEFIAMDIFERVDRPN